MIFADETNYIRQNSPAKIASSCVKLIRFDELREKRTPLRKACGIVGVSVSTGKEWEQIIEQIGGDTL